MSREGGDIETTGESAGGEILDQEVMEVDRRLRWAFVAGIGTRIGIIPRFLESHPGAACAVYVGSVAIPLLVTWPMMRYWEQHPANVLLLGTYTMAVSVSVGLAAVSTNGIVILQAVGMTATVVVGLTLYTFWGAKRVHHFSFLGSLFSACVWILVEFFVIQQLFPRARIILTICASVAVISLSAYILYEMEKLFKCCNYVLRRHCRLCI